MPTKFPACSLDFHATTTPSDVHWRSRLLHARSPNAVSMERDSVRWAQGSPEASPGSKHWVYCHTTAYSSVPTIVYVVAPWKRATFCSEGWNRTRTVRPLRSDSRRGDNTSAAQELKSRTSFGRPTEHNIASRIGSRRDVHSRSHIEWQVVYSVSPSLGLRLPMRRLRFKQRVRRPASAGGRRKDILKWRVGRDVFGGLSVRHRNSDSQYWGNRPLPSSVTGSASGCLQ